MISVRRPSRDFVGARVSSPLRAVPSTPAFGLDPGGRAINPSPTSRGKKPRRPGLCPEPLQCPGQPERRSIRRSPLRRPGGYPIRWPIFRRHRNRALPSADPGQVFLSPASVAPAPFGPPSSPVIVFAPTIVTTSPKGLGRRRPDFGRQNERAVPSLRHDARHAFDLPHVQPKAAPVCAVNGRRPAVRPGRSSGRRDPTAQSKRGPIAQSGRCPTCPQQERLDQVFASNGGRPRRRGPSLHRCRHSAGCQSPRSTSRSSKPQDGGGAAFRRQGEGSQQPARRRGPELGTYILRRRSPTAMTTPTASQPAPGVATLKRYGCQENPQVCDSRFPRAAPNPIRLDGDRGCRQRSRRSGCAGESHTAVASPRRCRQDGELTMATKVDPKNKAKAPKAWFLTVAVDPEQYAAAL